MSCVVVPKSQSWGSNSDHDNVGANGGYKIMKRSERAERR